MGKKETLLKNILSQELANSKKRNARYSLRAFAQSLKVSPATLSRILSGESNLSKKITNQIVAKLKIDEVRKKMIIEAEHDPYRHLITEGDIHALVDNWYFSPIVCLAETRGFKEDPKWIAKRLGITVSQVKKALTILLRIGLLGRDSNGKLAATDLAVSTTSPKDLNKPDKHFLDKTTLVRENILAANVDLREVSDLGSIMVASNPKKIKEVKKRTKTFRRNLAKFLDAGEKTEVYLIFTQVIPLSKIITSV